MITSEHDTMMMVMTMNMMMKMNIMKNIVLIR